MAAPLLNPPSSGHSQVISRTPILMLLFVVSCQAFVTPLGFQLPALSSGATTLSDPLTRTNTCGERFNSFSVQMTLLDSESERPATTQKTANHGRRNLLGGAVVLAASLLTNDKPVYAAYGEGAKQAAPPLLPNPFYPTGPMADTCIQVAAGRDDVCLIPKTPISAYESMQLDKQVQKLNSASGSVIVDSTKNMLELVKKSDFTGIQSEVGNVEAALAQLPKSTAGNTKAFRVSFETLKKELKKPKPEIEPGPVAKILIKMSTSVASLGI